MIKDTTQETKTVELKAIINAKRITTDIWAVSYVRCENADHAFLVIEGIGLNGERILRLADFCFAWAAKGGKRVRDYGYGCVLIRDIPLEEQEDRVEKWQEKGGLVGRTFALTIEQRERLKINIETDAKFEKLCKYNLLGRSVIAGQVGNSLDTSGSVESKTSAIESIHELLVGENSSGIQSVLSVLDNEVLNDDRRGHNCCSWAIETLQVAFYSEKSKESDEFAANLFEGSKLARLVVAWPKWELPSKKHSRCVIS